MINTVAEPREIKARKHHTCDYCCQRIMKGEKYNRATYSFEGEIYNWKTHKYCDKIAARMEMYKAVEHTGYGLSSDDFQEIISNKHFDLLIKLIPEELHKQCGDIIKQIRRVNFRDKLMYVIRHYARKDKLLK